LLRQPEEHHAAGSTENRMKDNQAFHDRRSEAGRHGQHPHRQQSSSQPVKILPPRISSWRWIRIVWGGTHVTILLINCAFIPYCPNIVVKEPGASATDAAISPGADASGSVLKSLESTGIFLLSS